MGIKSAHTTRNGIYYTPDELANFLVKDIITKRNISIFDPAHGQGSLLLAAEKKYISKFSKNELSLFGCDKNPKNGFLKHLPLNNFWKMDFFSLSEDYKFDRILLNPPYVRHHLLTPHQKSKYYNTIKDLVEANYCSDLWTYFLLKSIKHLKNKGMIGAILPWSFLQADYAQSIRTTLTKYFEEIKVLALGKDYFDNVKERILMVWLSGYKKPLKQINICYSTHIKEDLIFQPVSLKQWSNSKVIISEKFNLENIFDYYRINSLVKIFRELGSVKIGVVTGADNYFILNNMQISNHSFDKRNMYPIFTSLKELNNFAIREEKPCKYLLRINKNNLYRYEDYLKFGEENNYQLRAHSKLRKPWYLIKMNKIPDAFFPYRIAKIPYLIPNTSFQCTNSIHRIYYIKGLSKNQKKLIQLSFFTYVTQLSLESQAKVYGSGVLKIEPTALYNTLILYPQNIDIEYIFNMVTKLLKEDKKLEILDLVSAFYDKELKIPLDVSNEIKSAYLELLNRRISR
jgi:adenine-specific DNA-methyltransferase